MIAAVTDTVATGTLPLATQHQQLQHDSSSSNRYGSNRYTAVGSTSAAVTDTVLLVSVATRILSVGNMAAAVALTEVAETQVLTAITDTRSKSR